MQSVDGISLYQSQIVPNGQSSQTAPVEGEAAGRQELQQLGKGEVFEGVVIEVKDGYVDLSLSNGQTLRARLEAGVDLRMGEPVLFEVKANQDGQITLKQVPVESEYNPTLQKALTAAGLSLTQRNLEMVNTMMTKQMPIDKGSLVAMARLVQNFSQASAETLVQMKKLGFTVNEASVQQFEAYKAGEHSLVSRFTQIMEQLPELVEQLSQSAITDPEAVAENGSFRQLLAIQHQLLGVLELLKERPASQEQTVTQPASPEQAVTQPASPEQAVTQPASPEQTVTQPAVLGQPVSGKTMGEQPISVLTAGEQAASETAPADMATFHTTNGSVETTVGTIALEQQLRQISGMEENPLIFPEGKLNGRLGAGELLQAVQQHLENLQEGNTKAIIDFFQRKEYKTLFRQAMEEQWMLEPGQVEEKENIQQLYQRLSRQMEKLEQLLQNTGREAQALNKSVSQVRGSLEMMNQINQLYNYVQLPLKLQNQNAHSDLYVYTNKKRLQDKDGELSALLHLELAHLGTTDVQIKMLGTSVTTNFYLSDDASLRLVEQYVDQLKERLEEKGYHCSIHLEQGEQKLDVVEDFLEHELPLGKLQRYSFDVLT